ncbi:unnamed protein product [Rotaria sp. Silwood2]|nr:unnamed protein product [Rotaria sp. Silwood2]
MSLFVACTTFATVYAISSYVFLRKPQWIHRKRRPAFIVRHIAHRGGAGESIENSLLAFDKGLANGVEMLELDCHLTKDSQAIVHHDFALNRTTDQIGFIRDTEYDRLPRISSNIELYYDSGKELKYTRSLKKKKELFFIDVIISSDNNNNPENSDLLRIPLLKDVFERYPTIPINIDIKENNDELIRQVSDLIQQYRREHITYWGSFSHAICRKLTAQNPRVVRFCSLKEAAGIVMAYWVGLLPFIPLTPGAFEVPIPGIVFGKVTKNLDWKLKILFYLAERALNNASMFAHLQRRGIPKKMAQARTDAIVDSWNTKAKLNLTAEEEQHFKAWFHGAAERLTARRQAGKEVIAQLHAAVESNDSAKQEELLQKLREGFRKLSEGRERALDEFDKILRPEQRARIVVCAVQQAKESGRPVEHLIDSLLQTGDTN